MCVDTSQRSSPWLGHQLGIRQNPKTLAARNAIFVGAENTVECGSGTNWHGGLLDHDLALVGVLADGPADTFDESEIGGTAGSNTPCLGRRVHRSEDYVSVLDALLHVGRETQVL